MFWLFRGKKRVERLENETKNSFQEVKKDFEGVGKWIKHLDEHKNKHVDHISEIQRELTTIKQDLDEMKERASLDSFAEEHKQVFKKQSALNKQTPVVPVDNSVQTGVQTGSFHGIMNGLSSNERLLVFTLMNSELKLSYEDLARLLGKERSTVRGQVNSVKQKSEGLIQEIVETSGKKRVFVNEEVKEKLTKYAKVRVKKEKKYKKLPKY